MLNNMSQEEEIIPFEKIPSYLVKLRKDIKELKEMVEKQFRLHPPEDEWMDVNDLQAFHPNHPAKKTIYDWVTDGRIPYHKHSHRLRFRRSEIIEWLEGGYHEDETSRRENAIRELKNKRISGR